MPMVGSYVGGDITAGILASGMHRAEELSLLLDIGTNGEVVLGNRDFLVACSASAGPAFEGGSVTCGMRATSGAIDSVRILPHGPDRLGHHHRRRPARGPLRHRPDRRPGRDVPGGHCWTAAAVSRSIGPRDRFRTCRRGRPAGVRAGRRQGVRAAAATWS